MAKKIAGDPAVRVKRSLLFNSVLVLITSLTHHCAHERWDTASYCAVAPGRQCWRGEVILVINGLLALMMRLIDVKRWHLNGGVAAAVLWMRGRYRPTVPCLWGSPLIVRLFFFYSFRYLLL